MILTAPAFHAAAHCIAAGSPIPHLASNRPHAASLDHRRRGLHRLAPGQAPARRRDARARPGQPGPVLRPGAEAAQPRGTGVVRRGPLRVPRGRPARRRCLPRGGRRRGRRGAPRSAGRGEAVAAGPGPLHGRQRQRDPGPLEPDRGSRGPRRVRQQLVGLRRQQAGTLRRGAERRPAGVAVRRQQEGRGGALLHVAPPARQPGDVPAVLHGLRPRPAARNGDPQVRPDDHRR